MLPDFSQDHVYLHFHGRGAADREDASPNPGHGPWPLSLTLTLTLTPTLPLALPSPGGPDREDADLKARVLAQDRAAGLDRFVHVFVWLEFRGGC